MTPEKRIIELEMAVADLERTMDELNAEVVRQAKIIEQLEKEHKHFRNALDNPIRPQSEENKPPHY